MNKNIIRDLELKIEMDGLRDIGMTEEEIEGYFDIFLDNWEFSDATTFEN